MKKILTILGVVVVVLLVLAAVLPSILSLPPVRRAVLARVNAKLDGTLEVDTWSIGWFKGPRVEGIRYADNQASFGVTMERLTISSGLLKLLAPVKHVGRIDLVAPHIWCDMDKLAPAPTAGEPGSDAPSDKPTAEVPPSEPDLPSGASPTPRSGLPLALDVIATLAVQDAQLELRQPNQPRTTLRLNGTVTCKGLQKPVACALTADCWRGDALPAAGATPGLKLDGSALLVHDGAFDPEALVADAVLLANDFDLSSLALARAYVPTLPDIKGTLSSELTAKANGLADLTVTGGASLNHLQLEGGALGADHPRFEEIRLDVDLVRQGSRVVVKQLGLRSLPLTLRAAGELKPVAGSTYPNGRISVIGEVKLAEVAALFPHSLHLPVGTQIQDGLFRLDGKLICDGASARIESEASLRDLRGLQGGKVVQLSAPVEAKLKAGVTPTGVSVESVTLDASFAQINGGGNATGATFHVTVDLAAALREAGQFVDFGDLRAVGKLNADARVALREHGAREVNVDATLAGLSLSGLSARPGADAVPDVAGDLHAQATVAMNTNGATDLKGTLEARALTLRGGALGTDQANLAGTRVNVDLTQSGTRLDLRTFALQSPLATASATGIIDRVANAAFPLLDLTTKLTADLAALSAQLPQTLHLKPDVRLTSGSVSADTSLKSDGTTLNWLASAAVSPLAATRGQQALRLAEPVQLESRGSLRDKAIRFDALRLTAGFAQVDGSGDLARAEIRAQVNLDKAMAEIGQFVDVGTLRLGGQLDATAKVSSPSATDRRVDVDARIDKLLLAGKTPQPIRREQVRLIGGALIQLTPANALAGVRDLQLTLNGLPLALKVRAAQVAMPDAAAGTELKLVDVSVGGKGTMESLFAFCRETGLVKTNLPISGPLTFDAAVTQTADGFALQSLSLTTAAIGLEAKGNYAAKTSDRRLRLDGKLTSDCAELAKLTAAFSGFKPDMSGKATRDFSLDAPLGAGDWQAILRGTEAKAGLHADRFAQFGVEAKDIDLNLSVHAGLAKVVMDTVVNEGRLHAEPTLDVTGPQALLTLPANSPLLRGVKINDQMASKLLARIHPIFLGCVIVGGKLDFTMDTLRAPLGPRVQQETTFTGSMDLADLRLGPGDGLLGQLLQATQLSVREVAITNQHIRFECRDGRIRPSPLQISADGNPMIFTGSVGLDQTLQYAVEIPLTEKLVSKQVYPYLKDTTFKIPIGGTVSSPRFDKQAFTRAVAELAAKAAQNALLEEVRKRATDEGKKQGSKFLDDLLKQLPVQQ